MEPKAATFSALVEAGWLELGDGYRAKNEELGGSGLIFLRSAYLQDHGFVIDSPERFQSTAVDKFGAKLSRLGDVVITTKGNSTGRIGLIREEQAGAVYSPHLSYWRSKNSEKINQSFLYYWSFSQQFRMQLASMAHSTDMAPYLSLRDQLRLKISLLDITVQRSIGSVLSALDDKIELNRRMNETLEASARALFRDWFVDFGPTRAKAEGRPPYLAPDLWSLFPATLDAEGKPEGWEWSTIGKEVDAVGGSTPSTKDEALWNGDIAWTTPKDLSGLNSPVLMRTGRTISEAGLRAISSGLLPVGTVLMSSRAPVGYLAITQIPLAINQGYIAMRCDGRVSNWHAYLWAKENMDAILQNANGSTFQEISKSNFRPLPILVANKTVRKRFDHAVQPMFEQIIANEREIHTLAETRDWLLPKLMSGEIRVAQAEKLDGDHL